MWRLLVTRDERVWCVIGHHMLTVLNTYKLELILIHSLRIVSYGDCGLFKRNFERKKLTGIRNYTQERVFPSGVRRFESKVKRASVSLVACYSHFGNENAQALEDGGTLDLDWSTKKF